MFKILIIIPYFGKFPNYFDLWLTSVKYNSTINWLLITDNDCSNNNIPSNVQVLNMSFGDLKQRIQGCFDFEISLQRPYKLCDYRPAYGYIFAKELEQFDFWGYGDIDLIYGDLRHFITDEMLRSYDRIFACGHLSLIKNTKELRELFMEKAPDCFYYKDVFATDKGTTFDEFGQGEIGAFFQICQQSGIKIYNKSLFADVDTKFNRLQCNFGGNKKARRQEYKKKHVRFWFDRGRLFQLWKNKAGEKKELAYVHLQKRKMNSSLQNTNSFYIFPHHFSNTNRPFSFHFDEIGFQKGYFVGRFKNLIQKVKQNRA